MSEIKNKREQWVNAGVAIGMVVMLVMAALPLFGVESSTIIRAMYAAGAALVLLCRLIPVDDGGAEITLRERRLRRLLVVAAMMFAVSAVVLFLPRYTTGRDSIAFLLAGAVLQLYAGMMLDRLAAKRGQKPLTTSKKRKR